MPSKGSHAKPTTAQAKTRQSPFKSRFRIPKCYRLFLTTYRLLNLLPGLVEVIHNIRAACDVSQRDAGGAIVLRSTQIDYWVANAWVVYPGRLLELGSQHEFDPTLVEVLRDQSCRRPIDNAHDYPLVDRCLY
ncbi:hypothetical protein DFQ30_002576 [Apophysomyces sp. BC1015]|nr:hypothetical protein DFQ30_002576 [Apophysomyces sp. BC1015]